MHFSVYVREHDESGRVYRKSTVQARDISDAYALAKAYESTGKRGCIVCISLSTVSGTVNVPIEAFGLFASEVAKINEELSRRPRSVG